MSRLRAAPKILFPAILLGLAAFSGVIDLTSPPGPSLDPDALAYLGAGTSLAHGDGLRVPSAAWNSADTTAPLVHFPPAFPAAIAVGVAAGSTPINSARFVEATAAAVTIVALLLAANAAGGVIAALTVAGIVFATPAMIIVHAGILSEPLFLALLVLFTWQLAREKRGADITRTVTLGALAAAATLVRYAGIALVIAVVFEAMWTVSGPLLAAWRERVRRGFEAGIVPAVALALWMITRPHHEGAEKIREVGIYTAGFGDTIIAGFNTAARWLAPGLDEGSARTLAAIAVAIAGFTLVFRTVRAARKGILPANELRLYRASAIVLFSYAAVVTASRLLADPGIPFDERILSPVLVLTALRVGVAAASFWRTAIVNHRDVVLLTMGLVASWIWASSDVSLGWIRDYHTEGGDLAGHAWTASQLTAWAAKAPAGTRLYSNWPAAIWFATSRATSELPADLDSATAKEFGAKLAREHGAMLAFNVRAEDYAPPDSLAALAGLVAVERWPDGTVWRAPADAPASPSASASASAPAPASAASANAPAPIRLHP